MSVPIPLRVDFEAVQLRGLARKTKEGPQAGGFWLLRRFMTVRSARRQRRSAGSGFNSSRDWVLRFNARGPDGLLDGGSRLGPSHEGLGG